MQLHPYSKTTNFYMLVGSLVMVPALLLAQPDSGDGPRKALPVVVAPVVLQEDFGDTLEALGTTRANESVEITANVTEFVRDILFDDGDMVRKGDVLVRLEKAEEEAALKSAKALRDTRQGALVRARELVQQKALSTATLEERNSSLQQSEGNIDVIEAQLHDRVIRAPFDGVLGLRHISTGALVRPGDRITTIYDLSSIKVDFEVPSIYLQALRPGLEILGRVDAFEGEVFTGKVSTVDSQVDPVTRTVSVRAVVPNDSMRLLPGLLMAIEVKKNPRPSLLIPESAVLQRATNSFVLLIERSGDKSVAVERSIQTGTRVPGRVEALSGLQEGDQVVVHGLMQVRPGEAVEIMGVQTNHEPLVSFTGDLLKSREGVSP